jgi:hypothetical protein
MKNWEIPEIMVEIGGNVFWRPFYFKSDLINKEIAENGILIYKAKWKRIGWLIFSIGIVKPISLEIKKR